MSKPQVSTLKNGLTVITQHVPGEQVYTNVTVNVGYRHERPDQDNMAHFLEHMAAGENELLNTQERETFIQNRRGSMNATTNTERTDYWLQFSKEFAEDAVKLLADGFLRPKFDDKNVDVERLAVETELRSRVDNPQFINYQRIQQTAFPDTQLDKDRFETVDTVKNHTTQQLKDFKAIHYTGDNMALAVVGEVKHEEVVAWAEKHFAGLETAHEGERAAPPAVYRGGMKTYINPESPEVNISIGFESAGRKDPEAAAIDQLLSGILGSGTSSRLSQALVDGKQIARSASSYSNPVTDNGVLVLNAKTSPDSVKETIDTLAEESLKVASTVTQAELDKAKNRIIGDVERKMEDISETGEILAFTKAVDGKLYDLEEDLAILKNVTLDQLKARAQEVFKSPPSISVHGSDLSQLPTYEQISAAFGAERHLDEKGFVVQTEQQAAAALARATAPGKAPVFENAGNTPDVNAPESTAETPSAPEVTVLENGMKIITQKMPTKQIFANVRVGAGQRDETNAQIGLADIVCETSDAASERLSISAKSEAVANLRGTFESSAGLEATNFNIRAANEFTGDALHILAENFTSPKFDAENTKKQQTLVQKTLQSKKLDPQENTREQVRRVAFPGSQMDKNYLGGTEDIGKQTFEAAQDFKNQHYTADNMILSVVGDVDHAEIVKLAKEQFAGVKAHPDAPRPQTPSAKYRGGMEVKTNDASDQVTLRIAFEGSDRSDSKINAVDNLLGSILGGGFSSRLMSSLRSDKGLVYGANSFNAPMKDAGLFTIVTGTHQDKLAEVVDTIAEEVTRFAKTVTQAELDAVKNDQLGEFERALASPETIGASLSAKLSEGKVWDVNQSIQDIKDVTLEDIQKRATEIFSTAPSVAAFGKGADRMPSYEDISEKFGKRRSLDASGLAVDTAPANDRSVKGADVAAQPQDKKRAIG